MIAPARPEIRMADESVAVVGLGELGRPLYELVSRHYRTVGLDVDTRLEAPGPVGVMHVCYPFEIGDFVGETARYIERFRPRLTIINSTVAVGTTRTVAERTGAAVVHSPVRGKHTRMLAELLSYTKFVGPLDPVAGGLAAEHLASLGMRTRLTSSPEATELAKLTETTYFGLLIAWAQEVERYCDRLGLDDDEIAAFYDEVPFFPPVRYVPGVIGGHCVMPNLEILRTVDDSDLLRAIVASNGKKIEREARDALGSPR
jgi:UDP-N-acetyl-D-mannosaminuronate dehydrogenase